MPSGKLLFKKIQYLLHKNCKKVRTEAKNLFFMQCNSHFQNVKSDFSLNVVWGGFTNCDQDITFSPTTVSLPSNF